MAGGGERDRLCGEGGGERWGDGRGAYAPTWPRPTVSGRGRRLDAKPVARGHIATRPREYGIPLSGQRATVVSPQAARDGVGGTAQ